MITNLSGMGGIRTEWFATTADAFNQFLDQSGVNQRIYELLDKTDIDDVSQLAKAGTQIRQVDYRPLLSSPRWKTPSAMPMRSFRRMMKTPLFAGAFLRYGGRYARCLVCGSAGNVS
ncbi:phosphoenolpyruvate synthase [Salmonella enterica subsp. arizonae]|uniref:Phosphoenolpyruvate synthase n=1 Tax=Salmonella enterica subsp. arizonae TaxID=59203 RepID=A0A379SLS5_SALER|nr:phosphoenolpyruvate synthase [Salmonella enterica subsp. arizonae]